MTRHLKALAFVLTVCAVACAVAPPPRVVTVVTPYTPVLPLDPTNFRWLGAADCDLNGQPVIWIHPALRDDLVPWVMVHERIHVEQMKVAGGCSTFSRRVKADSMFRLHIEAEAYCGTLSAQRAANAPENPTYLSIVKQLAEDYSFAYERDSVIAALPCR